MKPVEDWKLPEKLEMEKGLLVSTSSHPLDAFAQAINQRVTANTAHLETIGSTGPPHHCHGQLDQPFTTQKGGIMAFLQLTDRNATFDATCSPRFSSSIVTCCMSMASMDLSVIRQSRGNDKIPI
jgi:DNA polymerase-3 subunit alpha